MVSEQEKNDREALILRIRELERVNKEQKADLEKDEAELARLNQAIADYKFDKSSVEKFNLVVNTLKDLERLKGESEKRGLPEAKVDYEGKLKEFKNFPEVKTLLGLLRNFIEKVGDINDFIEGEEKCDWYGLSGMPDLQPKK